MATQEISRLNNSTWFGGSSMLLRSIQLKNFLSFGTDTPELLLAPLNVFIGPNGSGKSNLIEAISLIRSTPNDMQEVLRKGGGVLEWIWKGGASPSFSIEVSMQDCQSGKNDDLFLRHFIAIHAAAYRAGVINEYIEDSIIEHNSNTRQRVYDFDVNINSLSATLMGKRVDLGAIDLSASILAQRRDPERYPEITFLADWYVKVRIYREWAFGRNTIFREPQRADMRTDRLEEDFSNLGLFLNKLRRNPQAKNKILTHLRDIYEGVDDFDVSIEGGTVQVFFTEGNFTIPATRLSDGTLRYLCLLAILCDPTPPPLICIEEPELGLHPDLLPKIADLLVEASERTQLIVTTHSETLVDAMTEHPEAVVICEKHNGQTQMKRLSAEDLSVWLEKYRLGDLWISGQLGGTRW